MDERIPGYNIGSSMGERDILSPELTPHEKELYDKEMNRRLNQWDYEEAKKYPDAVTRDDAQRRAITTFSQEIKAKIKAEREEPSI